METKETKETGDKGGMEDEHWKMEEWKNQWVLISDEFYGYLQVTLHRVNDGYMQQ